MYKVVAIVIALLLPVLQARAWSDHASLVWPLARSLPGLAETVSAESLDAFIAAEAVGLVAVLDQHEAWSIANVEHYPATPAGLRLQPGSVERTSFLQAIRVNPRLPFLLYRQQTVDDPEGVDWPLSWVDLSFLGVGSSHESIRYRPLMEGESVKAAHVVASGSDEPDFGMDIGLYENNGTEHGLQYGFGSQPFGNPNLDYGSQAPFHMGFYHLDWLTRLAQPDLLRTLPLWRISLYGRLSDFAFASGHPYWGWRFLGWALHYVGDLTQPYHATPLPGVGTIDALWLVAQGRTGEAIQLVSNRHGVLESYQFQRVNAALAETAWQSPLLQAISSPAGSELLTEQGVIDELTATSVDAAAALDGVLTDHVPARFVADPSFEWTGSGFESDVVALIQQNGGSQAITALDATVVEQLTRFGEYARRWIERGLRASAEAAGD